MIRSFLFMFLFSCVAPITSALDLESVYIALYQRNMDVLHNHLLDISNTTSLNYGAWMNSDEINYLAHPFLEHQNQVLEWIDEYNVTSVENYGDAMKFSAPYKTIQNMFQLADGSWTGYTIPSFLSNIIEFVEMGCTPTPRISKRNYTGNNADDRYFAREPMVHLYNITHLNLGKRVSGGVIEYQNNAGFTNEDVDRQQILNEQGVQNITHIVGDNEGIDAESELDVQMLSQSADGIDAWYWNNDQWLYAFAVDFYNSAIIPKVISMSWGWAEDSQCDIVDCTNLTSAQYVSRVNNEYLKIALRGVTITAASGDAGAPGRTNEECSDTRPINPVFPGSSPYVLSVGATFVSVDNSTRNYTSPLCLNDGCITSTVEKSIRFDRIGWTAGGGFDLYHHETPLWQRDAVRGYLSSGVTLPPDANFNRYGRAYPDVSAIGHSCPTILDGSLTPLDGTSCSAPLVAGLIAIINDYLQAHNRSTVGFVNPLLYQIHANCPDCFRDITDGYNWCTESGCCKNTTEYGFVATKGFDPVAGLGTLNIGNILAYLKQALRL